MVKRVSLLFALVALFLTACSGGGAPQKISSGATLNATQFADAITRENTVILDVRTPQEFAEAHIEGAVNVSVEAPDFAAQLAQLDKSKNYALYCRSGNRSATAMSIMRSAGFEAVYHLGGGIGAWTRAGKPVVR